MVRKLALAVALAAGTLPMAVHALGLGEISVKSKLNQNLRAEIPLYSVPVGELDGVKVGLASTEVFQRAGIDRFGWLSAVRFEATRKPDGTAVIQMVTDFPVREPFMDFMIEVNWPEGRVVREYTLLLDPPTVTQRRPGKIAAPTTAPRTETAARAAAPQAAPARVTRAARDGEYGPVQTNETLWEIADSLRADGVSVHQMMLAMFNANPDAFLRGNMNLLKQGAILRVPDSAEAGKFDRQAALDQFRAQAQSWLAGGSDAAPATATVDTDAPRPAATASTAVAAGGVSAGGEPAGRLKIASPAAVESGKAGAEGSKLVDEAGNVAELQERLLVAREEAVAARQENSNLRQQMTDLEVQLKDMQRLMSLKDDQLAQMQAGLAQAQAEAEAAAAAAAAAEAAGKQPAPAEAAEVAVPTATAVPTVAAVPEPTIPPDALETYYQQQKAAEASAPAPTEVAMPPVAAVAPEPAAAPTQKPAKPAKPAEKPAKPPKPAATKPVKPAPAPVTPASTDEGWGNLPLWAGGALLAALAVGGLLMFRRRQPAPKQSPELPSLEEESILLDESTAPAAPAAAGGGAVDLDTSFLSEYSTEDLQSIYEDTRDVDAVSEAEVYLAYGRYDQAKEILTQAIEKDPDRNALRFKLLEVHYARQDRDSFLNLTEEMLEAGQQEAEREDWEKVRTMGRDLGVIHPFFEGKKATAGPAATAATVSAAAAAAAPVSEEESGRLSRLVEELDTAFSEDSQLMANLDNLELEAGESAEQEPGAASADEEVSPAGMSFDQIDTDSMPTLALDSGEMGGGDQLAGAELDLDVPTDLNAETELHSELSASTLVDLAGGKDSGWAEDVSSLENEIDDLLDTPLDVDIDLAAPDLVSGDSLGDAIGQVVDAPLDESSAFAAAETLAEEEDTTSGQYEDVQIKLELAQTYVELGHQDDAKALLGEILQEGNASQRAAATELMQGLES